ncbi:porin family protein [Hymenobacter terrenus]|uniref:porin family protein n=1 Tax=Hymenobacter terrenus TaxID=1629124 RepID=UPI000695D4D6|nr:porin family protein [Hymenobacter terrenus]
MKKTLLFLLLTVASMPAAFAQARPGGSLSSKDYTGGGVTDSRNTGFGIKGGYNLSGVRGSDIKGIERQSRNDFHAGLYGQFGFNNFSSIQAELLYSRQGFEANTGTAGARQQYRLDYLMLPVMYVGNVTETISFHIGPQVSLLTKAKLEDRDLGLSRNGFNTLDFGGVGGLEARVGPARIGARYNLSLGKIFEDSTPENAAVSTNFGNSDIYNNLLQVYVGIGFTQ